MKLRRLEIQNFRAFAEADVDVPESGVLLIAGTNNAGKSALLSAIDVIATGTVVAESAHHGAAGAPSITATFRLAESEVDELWQGARENRAQYPDALSEVRFAFRDQGLEGMARLALVQVATTWPPQGEVVLARYDARNPSPVSRNDAVALLTGRAQPSPIFNLRAVGGRPVIQVHSGVSHHNLWVNLRGLLPS